MQYDTGATIYFIMSFTAATIQRHPLTQGGVYQGTVNTYKTQIPPFILGWGCILNCVMYLVSRHY